MQLEPGEIQILTGPGLTVTDRRVDYDQGEAAIASLGEPLLKQAIVETKATRFVLTLALILTALGLFTGFPMFWIAGVLLALFGARAKFKRQGFAVSAEVRKTTTTLYQTHDRTQAELALAALLEAKSRNRS